MRLDKTEFVASAPTLSGLPPCPEGIFEIAILGRSNVGKSTFLNRIVQRKKLARASKTPGRTQHVVLFATELVTDADLRHRIWLADLPGFGFAKVSKKQRAELAELIEEFITQRGTLRLLCMLSDIRREPEEEEHAYLALAQEAGANVLVVLTKTDKLNRTERARQMKVMERAYGLEESDFIEAGEGVPIEGFLRRVAPLI